MTHNEIVEMLEETNLPIAYDHFAEGESPDPPFLLFLSPRENTFSADNLMYHSFVSVKFSLARGKKK
jgi:hypothetical protein